MKTMTFLTLMLVGGTLALAACGEDALEPRPDGLEAFVPAASSAPVITEFTATDLPAGILDPGEFKFQNNRIIARGLVVRARIEASDPRFSGFMVAELNSSWSLEGEGPVWGKITHEVDGGGVLEGIWRAYRSRTAEGVWTGAATWTAQGRGGSVEGVKAWGTETITSFSVIPSFYVGEIHGYIANRP